MANTRKDHKQQVNKKKYKWLKIAGIAFFAILIISGAAVGYFFNRMANLTAGAQHELDRGEISEMREVAVNPAKDNFSVLFLGLDDRDGSLKGRTDAILLATFNKQEKTVKMLNIPRDSRVEIVGRDRYDKINHAHAFGGLDMTVATVENLLDIPVDYFVKLNFDAFMDIIDALGGVDVDVPFSFSEMDSDDRKGAIQINEGVQTLNGEEALAYVRMRKSDPRGDLGRGDRQKQVLEAIIEKSASFSTITRFDDLLQSLEGNLLTNLSFGNILSLHPYASGLRNIESLTISGEGIRLNRIFYYELDEEALAEVSTKLQVHLGLIDPPVIEVDGELEEDTNQ